MTANHPGDYDEALALAAGAGDCCECAVCGVEFEGAELLCDGARLVCAECAEKETLPHEN